MELCKRRLRAISLIIKEAAIWRGQWEGRFARNDPPIDLFELLCNLYILGFWGKTVIDWGILQIILRSFFSDSVYLTRTTAQRCRSETEKNILEGLFSSVLSKLKKFQPSGKLKFNHLRISQSLKFLILMEKNPSNFSYAKFHSQYFGL